jgi:serine/threonine protein phosphatase 1
MTNNSDFEGEVQESLAQIRVISDRPARLFAIGDVHGCADELGVMLRELTEREALSSSDLVVFMGDYVDRGPSSKGVVDLLLDFRQRYPQTVFLKGNHEDMLLDFLGFGGHLGENYLANGGKEFFASYGIDPTAHASNELGGLLPQEHVEFLCSLELGVTLAEFLFVHAGISPFRELDKQLVHDLMWIRRDFTTFEHQLGKTVVFGHTPYENVMVHLPFKIGIDTGLVYGNKLSAVELVYGGLLQVERGEKTVIRSSLRQ